MIFDQQLGIVETGRNRRYLKSIYRSSDNATASFAFQNQVDYDFAFGEHSEFTKELTFKIVPV
jgi:hypothetical protein